ncbi:MAG: CRISPR-associated endoribonuclease Cas6 [Eggerthia catenaformis]|uniref:CRISPR-associated endoribonuclease Cas6 n=1 Tax=Eggerthia catenaformis TaxID=31973 RepID=UPI00047DE826|nr:CRISPR-associated endoribonuclease Cas6 [Eggerthia catenaformis]
MKYTIKMQLKEAVFKSDYRRTIISFFKKSISLYQNGIFYSELYSNGAIKKSLVWSIGFKNPQFNKDIIKLDDTTFVITLKISDPETALIYYSSLLEMKNIEFPLSLGNSMQLKSIEMSRETIIKDNFAIFKVLSPICLKKHINNSKDWYVSIGDDDFACELERKLMEDLPYHEEKIKSLMFHFDDLRKIVVRAYGLKIPATIGTFAVKGDAEILNHILKNGIGSKKNSGFGLVEIITQNEVTLNDL